MIGAMVHHAVYGRIHGAMFGGWVRLAYPTLPRGSHKGVPLR